MRRSLSSHKIDMEDSPSVNITGWIVDGIVRAVVNRFIPLPLPREIIVQLKGIIVSIGINFLLILILVLLAIFGVVALPFLTGKLSMPVPPISDQFKPTDIPELNPLGGDGLSYVTITAYFHDPQYFAQFGIEHEGVDMVPNSTYYEKSSVYKKYSPNVIVYATNNGTIQYFTDQYGANVVIDENSEGNLQSEYLHMNSVFVHSGETVTAGTALGTMGDTGFSTGAHVHYQINVNQNGTWTPTDPLQYIQ